MTSRLKILAAILFIALIYIFISRGTGDKLLFKFALWGPYTQSYLFEVQSNGLLTVSSGNLDPINLKMESLSEKDSIILSRDIVYQTREFTSKSIEKESDNNIALDAMSVIIKVGDVRKEFTYGLADNKKLNNLIRILVGQSPIDIEDKAGNKLNLEYRNDKQPILDRFKTIPAFQTCYWKADTIGSIDFGPTNYWMKGFVVLEKSSFQKVLDEYSWEPLDLEFPKGIDPKVTNFNEFNWCHNKEFESQIITLSFIGNFYLDTNNGILYFSVENN